MLAAGLLLALVGTVSAEDGTGLGASWPAATDVSSAPQLHAYVWQQSGMEYVQINDGNGTPLVAVATNGRIALVLPIGQPQLAHVLAADHQVSGTPVYSDSTVTVQMTTAGFTVQPQQLRSNALCKDPIECSGPAVAPQASTSTPPATQSTSAAATALAVCKDPIECSGPAVSTGGQ